jgi:putative membrane protein
LIRFVLRLLVSAGAVLLAQAIPPGDWVRVASPVDAIIFALVLGLLNALVRPVLLLLTCPLNLVTLGLFVFVVNAAVFGLAAWFLPGVAVNGFLGALVGSLVVSVCSTLANQFLS